MRARVDLFPMDGGLMRTFEGEIIDHTNPNLPNQIWLLKADGNTVVITPGVTPYALTLYTGTK